MSKATGKRRIGIGENIKMSMRAIAANKLRAALTSLGIIIGVATVIAMMSVVGGINQIVEKEFSRMGADVFTVQKTPSIHITFDWKKYRLRKDLQIEDAKAIKRNCPSVDMVSPMVYRWRGEIVRAEGRKTDPTVAVAATNEYYLPITGMSLDLGRNFTPREAETGARVCTLGYDVVERLFPYGSPIGRYVRIRSDRYRRRYFF